MSLKGKAIFSTALLVTSIFVTSDIAHAADCTPETTTNGGRTIVAFKTVGTCTWNTPAGATVFRGLVVAGGGGGGAHMGGGGGGGGYIEFDSLTATSDIFTITVGDGGAGAPVGITAAGNSGGNTTLTGSGVNLLARGGAGGATDYVVNSYLARNNGGSGGGSSGANDYPNPSTDRSSAGTQTSQTQVPSLSSIGGTQYGFNGSAPGSRWYPGGGGGAGASGSNTPGTGGAGRANSILGTNYFWAGGGGGSGWSGIGGNGGSGGGGGGGSGNISAGIGGTGGSGLNSGASGVYVGGAGGSNTGGGGGAGTYSNYAGANGGSGILVLSYVTFIGNTTISLQLSGGATTATYRTTSTLEAVVGTAGKVTFYQLGKPIPGCRNKTTSGSAPNIKATCTWKPSNRGVVQITASINPISGSYALTRSLVFPVLVANRTTPR